METNIGGKIDMAIVNGKPAIAYINTTTGEIRFISALDVDGITWGPSIAVATRPGFYIRNVELAEVNGHPAIIYHNPDTAGRSLEYTRANDANGTTWNAPITIATSLASVGNVNFEVINNTPTVAYVYGQVYLIEAVDMNGNSWTEPQEIFGSYGTDLSLIEMNSQWALAYHDGAGQAVKFTYNDVWQGNFTYTPNANWCGTDSFTYHAISDVGNSNTSTVTLQVNCVEDLPVASVEAYTITEDTLLTIVAPGVLANDTDGDNDPLTACFNYLSNECHHFYAG